jgi:hypothetical protein
MVVAYGFAAANTVGESAAGEGDGTVSGYTVSAIRYTLDNGDPTDVDQVVFTIDPDSGNALNNANTGYIQFDSLAGTWFPCTLVGTTATCDTSGSNVPVGATFTQLTVVAAQ